MEAQTPLRSKNGYWIQMAGIALNLHRFAERRAQNKDGSGYNIFTGMELVETFVGTENPTAKDLLADYMAKHGIKVERECSIIDLPAHFYITKEEQEAEAKKWDFQGKFTFRSPINLERSITPVMENLSEDTESQIEVKIRANGTGYFEWTVDELDLCESGGLWFDENKALTDYDGVFDLPKQLVEYLEQNGYNMDYVKD